MTGPRAVEEWIVLFERFGAGDDTVLDAMNQGTLALTGAQKQHWQAALFDALAQRLARLSVQLGEQLKIACVVGDLSSVLGWLRAQLEHLFCLSRVRVFPRRVREHVERSCSRWLAQSQVRLEDEAAHSPEPELWRLTVRRSPLRWPPPTSTC
jgi:hypothetical protein